MENIILGLLLLQARTIYQLKKRINDGLSLMYSCSTGSIQAAIKKLLKGGHISVAEVCENGKNKKLYSITTEGQKQFYAWLNSPIDCSSKGLTKVYFMGLSEKQVQAKLIESYIHNLQKDYAQLDKICKEGEAMSIKLPENDVLFFQLQTAKYGRDLTHFNIVWFKRLLKNIRSKI